MRITKEKCIIIGAGKYGQVYAEYLKEKYDIIAFYDDDVSLHGKRINNIYVKNDVQYAFSLEKDIKVFVPLGNNRIRVKILKEFEEKGFETPSFIHPQTIIDPSVQIGKAVYILPGTNIMPLTVIGDYTMISIGVNISHHSKIGMGCFFSYGTNIGASMDIYDLAYIGAGATLMTGVNKIGKNSLIGAGAVVIRDVPDNAVMAGVPAKILKYKENE